jgi:hypothetical protein
VDWPSLVRKYVWDEHKTPYLLSASRLSPRQAWNELFVYSFTLAMLASVAAVLAALGVTAASPVRSSIVALYAVSVVIAAIALGATGWPAAARYCTTAPVAMALGALTGALRPGMSWGEVMAIAAVSVLWLRYAARVVRLTERLRGA